MSTTPENTLFTTGLILFYYVIFIIIVLIFIIRTFDHIRDFMGTRGVTSAMKDDRKYA